MGNTAVTGMGMMGNRRAVVVGATVGATRRSPVRVFAMILIARTIFAAPDSTFWKPPVFSRLDSLFIVAATGEPKFETERAASQKALLAMDTVAFQYLLDHRLTGQTPRQRHYVETFFRLADDSGRNAEPRRLLAQALPAKPDSLKAQLLYIGSEMRDTAFRREAIPYLHSDSSGVRRMAVRCLGVYPNLENVVLLWENIDPSTGSGTKTSGLELQQRLWSLDQQGPVKDWKRLVPMLRDSLFFNRQKVRDMLLKSTDSSWVRLRPALPASLDSADRVEACLLALDAKGGEGFLDSNLSRLGSESRELLQRYRK